MALQVRARYPLALSRFSERFGGPFARYPDSEWRLFSLPGTLGKRATERRFRCSSRGACTVSTRGDVGRRNRPNRDVSVPSHTRAVDRGSRSVRADRCRTFPRGPRRPPSAVRLFPSRVGCVGYDAVCRRARGRRETETRPRSSSAILGGPGRSASSPATVPGRARRGTEVRPRTGVCKSLRTVRSTAVRTGRRARRSGRSTRIPIDRFRAHRRGVPGPRGRRARQGTYSGTVPPPRLQQRSNMDTVPPRRSSSRETSRSASASSRPVGRV